MLEGVVHQLLLGYLGRYVKDFSKDQVKVTLWSIEVELSNIELILEAFDYLQLPFALRQGRVGKLRIKIPWKTIGGGEPIIIALEDVFFHVSTWDDDQFWTADAVDKRELAGKKAKLAAAELAKLSTRVSDNGGGQSFISYITGKVLENIQVFIRNFHVLFCDMKSDMDQLGFGLRFSSLTISKQNPARLRKGQVSKVIEIQAFEIYCGSKLVTSNSMSVQNAEDHTSEWHSRFSFDKFEYLLEPLTVNRAERLNNDLPQYSVTSKLPAFVVCLNEVQLQHILFLSDYLSTSQLREKYGRYRPKGSFSLRKGDGWQKRWWLYAQNSILSDVHMKLKKTSWRWLGERLNNHRKYVNLYKTKLEFLLQDQPMHESIFQELEKMEKDHDADDILSYRSAAESEMQDILSSSSKPKMSAVKSSKDGLSFSKSRGWLNWLSRGMLGAGGTDDFSQFSGVVTDEDIQDMYEATNFDPHALLADKSDCKSKISTLAIEFSVHRISLTLYSMKTSQEIAMFNLHGAMMECKLCDDLATMFASVSSAEIVYPYDSKVILSFRESDLERNGKTDKPIYKVEVDLSPTEVELSVHVIVTLESVQIACEPAFFLDLLEFFSVYQSFESQHDRVLSSLNGIEDAKCRLLAKAEYAQSSNKKLTWDVTVSNIIINFPFGHTVQEQHAMVLEFGFHLLTLKPDLGHLGANASGCLILKNLSHALPTSDLLVGFQIQDLYDYFELSICNFEMRLMMSFDPQSIYVVEKFSSSVTYARCLIACESILKQLEVYICLSSLRVHFSPEIYESFMAMIAHLKITSSRYEPIVSKNPTPYSLSGQPVTSVSNFSVTATLDSASLLIDLDNNRENSSIMILFLREIDLRYSHQEVDDCWFCSKGLQINFHHSRDDGHALVLCSCWNIRAASPTEHHDLGFEFDNWDDRDTDKSKFADACFFLHYECNRAACFSRHHFTVCLNQADVHVYPLIVGLMSSFYDRICSLSRFDEAASGPVLGAKFQKPVPDFEFQKFGFSNFSETGNAEQAGIPLDCFPFVAIYNSGSLSSIESSLRYTVLDWRKFFISRDRKIRNPRCSLTKRSEVFSSQSQKTTSSEGVVCPPTSTVSNLCLVNFDLSRVRVHFHDSSSIVATITLPSSKSSLCIYHEFLDLVSSADGLILASSFWTKNIHDFICGPMSPNFSPVLNIRMRKGAFGLLSDELEVSIGIQHMCCILPPDFLAFLIGYFSLLDWTSGAVLHHRMDKEQYTSRKDETSVIYKFEVLDSYLIFPVDGADNQFLQLEIRQFYCSFTEKCVSSDFFRDIPPSCVVPEHKVSTPSHFLNIFGIDLSLLLLLFTDGKCGSLTDDSSSNMRKISLIPTCSADVWVRIPCESELSGTFYGTTCIMSRISACQMIVDDGYSSDGFCAVLQLIDQFSSVDDQSKCYQSDVLMFLERKRPLKYGKPATPKNSAVTSTEIRFCVDLLSIQACRCGKELAILEPIAKAHTKFVCSASLENDVLMSMDISFSHFSLLSLLNAALLGQCSHSGSASSVLSVSVKRNDQYETQIHVYLPSVDIWLYYCDWMELIHLLDAYDRNTFETVWADSNISFGDALDPVHVVKPIVSQSSVKAPGGSSNPVSENTNQPNSMVIIRSETIDFAVHFPLYVVEVPAQVYTDVHVNGLKNESFPAVKREYSKHLTVAACTRSFEVFITHEYVRFKFLFDTTMGTLIPSGHSSIKSWPFFHIYEINLEGEMCSIGESHKRICLKVNCDRVDIRVSNRIFVLWNEMKAGVPKSASSKYAYRHFEVEIRLRKISFLLSDERWNCSGPLFEIFLRNVLLHANMTEGSLGSSVTCDLEVNYNNIQKVLWESFIEPWEFQMRLSQKLGLNALINSSNATEVYLTSTSQLNFNITEQLMETVFRATDMVKDALALMRKDPLGNGKSVNSQLLESMSEGRYAPYVLQNLTSLSLMYHVHQCSVDADLVDLSEIKDRKTVSPGASVPIYFNDTLQEQILFFRPSLSWDNLTDNQRNGVGHHFMTIQLDGTSTPSSPLSIDLVGVTCFEVDLSNASNDNRDGTNAESKGCVVPVVFDVSTQHYSKLIRLYSTVVFRNASSVPLELRFDIPFGISPMILDPVHPGQEVPLPLHLAEAGRMRWRPLGNCYLWSEAHNIYDILVQESKIGFSRSFVCYPSHPSSDPFRCCISVQQVSVSAAGKSDKAMKEKSKSHFLHQVTLSTPFIVSNYLPEVVSLTVESGGITCTVVLSEVVTFFHHIDHSHDLFIVFNISGFRPSPLKFPRTEAFSSMAKFCGTKFSQSETLTFDTDIGHGAINVIVEKTMDAFSGAREVFILVPFLLYNCTAFPLLVSDCINEMKGTVSTVPSYYDQLDQEPLQSKMDGLCLLFSEQKSSFAAVENDSSNYFLPKDSMVSSIVSSRKVVPPCLERLSVKPLSSSGNYQDNQRTSDNSLNNRFSLCAQSVPRDNCIGDKEYGKVKACIFSPNLISTGSEAMVCISRCLPGFTSENMPKSLWSLPFPLVPPSGSINVLLPHLRSSAASIISVTSTALGGPFAGRTRAITFQPRFVISNACSKDLLYKQKGTNVAFHLGMAQHCQLQWTDTTRDLLVSLCFEEPGWQWSGSFLPDHLGDTLVKMRNCLSGASNMLRVEVQNSDPLVKDDTNAEILQENSGTNLIILSDDHSGYMPYRIDNFSKEKLRLYQQKCESLDTIIYPYTSCSYAWDEPSYPHRLTVEVPGERILGSYALDELKDFIPVHLQSTSEKPERTLLLSIRAEGAKKVFSIIDSNYHIWNDVKDRNANRSQVKERHEQSCNASVKYTDRFSVALPSIGFSFIDSSPQELIFACAKNFTLYLHQNVEQQKLCFQISSLQMDNQLSSTHYPVLLSFTSSNRNNPVLQMMTNDEGIYTSRRPAQLASDISNEPVLYLAVTKWRKKDDALVSFEYISLRIADFCLQLEQEAILGLLYFLKPIFQKFESLVLPKSDVTAGPGHGWLSWHVKSKDVLHEFDLPFFNRTDGSAVSLPSVVPIGAPCQKIHLLARSQRKIYVELLDLAPITFTLSFSSSPWMLKNGIITSGDSLIHRGFMAFANVEGAQIYLKQLTIGHQMGSWESIQEILIRHYVRQFLHESYKVFGSAGVIGNPMGFARSLGAGIRDFLSAPAKNIFQSPTGIITGIGKGTSSLVTSTVYAISDAATQFSKAAHKGIVAFTFDDLATARLEKQQKGEATQSKGVINEVFEGLTGLLQSPVKEAEKHGLPGILSGVALGVTGLVAKPAASILEATGRTAQSIRNRSRLYHLGSHRYRLRLPRPLSRELPLRPYSWEEAVGASVLKEGDEGFKDEVFVMSKSLKQPGEFVILTERIIVAVSCSSLVDLGKPEFLGIALDPQWRIETEISLQSIIHMDIDNEMVHIVGSSSDALLRKKQHLLKKGSATRKQWNNSSTPLPISQTNLELKSEKDAQEFSMVVSSKLDQGKERGWGSGLMLHQRNIR